MFHPSPNDDVPTIPKEVLKPKNKLRRLLLVILLLMAIFTVLFTVSGCTRCYPNVCPSPFSQTGVRHG